MGNALARGNFVVSVELVPPRGYRAESLVEQARHLRIHGVDLVNIPDGPRATGRMSALAAAVMVQQQAGVETILHYACRDRNMIGMQSDLLGAHAMDVRNLLIVTGDPPRVGDYPDATAVYEVDSIGLTNLAAQLNRGLDIGGQPIGQATAFHIGVAANPGAFDLDQEVRRFEYKVEAGAEFAITQPVFDVAAMVRSFSIASSAGGFPCWRPSPRSRACVTPNSWPTKCRASACRTSYWSVCDAPRSRDGHARKASRSPGRSWSSWPAGSRGCRLPSRPEPSDTALAVLEAIDSVTHRPQAALGQRRLAVPKFLPRLC